MQHTFYQRDNDGAIHRSLADLFLLDFRGVANQISDRCGIRASCNNQRREHHLHMAATNPGEEDSEQVYLLM